MTNNLEIFSNIQSILHLNRTSGASAGLVQQSDILLESLYLSFQISLYIYSHFLSINNTNNTQERNIENYDRYFPWREKDILYGDF
jgi:hypothetical protein